MSDFLLDSFGAVSIKNRLGVCILRGTKGFWDASGVHSSAPGGIADSCTKMCMWRRGAWVFLFALLYTVQQEEVGLGNVFLPRHAECIFDSHFKVPF